MLKPSNEVLYTYNAEVVRVIDGDTIIALIDLGHNLHIKRPIRLLGVDTPEIRTKDEQEKINGYICKKHLENIFKNVDNQCIIQTVKRDSFGRWLANIWVGHKRENVVAEMQIFMEKNGYEKR